VGNKTDGGAEAFAHLYSQRARRIRTYVARRVGTSAAEEVTAEVFLVAWRRWSDAEAHGLPWLYITAQHAVSNHLRGERRHDQALRHLTTVARSAATDVAAASADRVVAARALLELSEQDREVLLAIAWDGLSVAELAGVLGCSTATAHVRLHRARRRLDTTIRMQDPHSDPTVERAR